MRLYWKSGPYFPLVWRHSASILIKKTEGTRGTSPRHINTDEDSCLRTIGWEAYWLKIDSLGQPVPAVTVWQRFECLATVIVLKTARAALPPGTTLCISVCKPTSQNCSASMHLSSTLHIILLQSLSSLVSERASGYISRPCLSLYVEF